MSKYLWPANNESVVKELRELYVAVRDIEVLLPGGNSKINTIVRKIIIRLDFLIDYYDATKDNTES